MEKAVFLAMVLADANQLKEKATTDEKSRVKNIQPAHMEGCILAKMTGRYDSARALELLKKTIYQNRTIRETIFERYGKQNVQKNEVHFGQGNFNFTDLFLEALTTENTGSLNYAPLEMFIQFDGANTDELIAFIRDERDTFEPRMCEA